nr:unnamed protein product [Digitaria exilis]
MDGVLQDVVVMAAVVDVVAIIASVAGVAAARSLVAIAGLLVLATKALVMGLLHQGKASGLAIPRQRLRLLAALPATPRSAQGRQHRRTPKASFFPSSSASQRQLQWRNHHAAL